MRYTAKIKQPQTVCGVRLEPSGGDITERQYRTIQKDKYGASLLEKGLLIVEGAAAPAHTGETVPDFESREASAGKSRPEDERGWKPE